MRLLDQRMRRRLLLVGAITLVSMGWIVWHLDWGMAWQSLSQAAWIWFAPMMVAYLLTHSLRTLRLWVLLGRQIDFMRVFAINTIGFLAINVIPLRLGEMVRPYLLFEREQHALGDALAAILLERLLDVLLLLIMLMGLTLWIELPVEGIQIQGVDVISATQKGAGVLLTVGLVGGTAAIIWAERFAGAVKQLPKGQAIFDFILRFRDGIGRLFTQPFQALFLLAVSASIWGSTIGAVACAMMAFDGIPVSLASAWSTWTITLCGMTAVPTPGFFGIYELSCAAALLLWDVEPNLATTFAVSLHIGQLIFTLVLGGLFLFLEGLSLRSLIRPAQESTPQPVGPHS